MSYAAPTSQAVTAPSSPCDTTGAAAPAGIVTLVVGAPRSLVRGTAAAVSTTAIDAAGVKTDVTDEVTWTSSDLLAASATRDKLYGINAGHVTLTATLGEVSSSADIDVLDLTVQALTISADAETSRSGALSTWHVIATYNDGSTADVTAAASWSTSDPTIALVEQPGQIRALKEGMAMITASRRRRRSPRTPACSSSPPASMTTARRWI